MCVPEIGQSLLGFTASPVAASTPASHACVHPEKRVCRPALTGLCPTQDSFRCKEKSTQIGSEAGRKPSCGQARLPPSLSGPRGPCPVGSIVFSAGWLPGLPQARVPAEPALFWPHGASSGLCYMTFQLGFPQLTD